VKRHRAKGLWRVGRDDIPGRRLNRFTPCAVHRSRRACAAANVSVSTTILNRRRLVTLALCLITSSAALAADVPIFRAVGADGAVAFSDVAPGTARTAYRKAIGRPTATASCTGLDRRALDERARQWRPRIVEAASRHALEPALLEALVRVESCFDPSARSRAGAQGLTQLMPGTADELGVIDPLDAVTNLDGGARYLAAMLRRFGDETLALAAYNAGPGNVVKHGGVPPFPETVGYVRRIAALRRQP